MADVGDIGEAAGGFGQGLAGLGDFGTTLFGQDTEVSGSGTTRQRLNIDEAGVLRLVEGILGGTQGLASIFSEEQVAGLFDSSVAAQASGDLLAKVAGEVAKLKAEQITTTTETQTTEEEGLIEDPLKKLGANTEKAILGPLNVTKKILDKIF
jgi:hypothetical protein